jgi:large subunit ribosomal protein L34e
MPQPRFRSRTFRRIKTRLPSGKVVTHHEKRKPELPKCAVCKKALKGMPRAFDSKKQKMGISKKRPERPFGGNLCSDCSRKQIKQEARV